MTAIVSAIDAAEKFIYIAVGEYVPMDLFKQHKPWTMIDDRLRAGGTLLSVCLEKYYLVQFRPNMTILWWLIITVNRILSWLCYIEALEKAVENL